MKSSNKCTWMGSRSAPEWYIGPSDDESTIIRSEQRGGTKEESDALQAGAERAKKREERAKRGGKGGEHDRQIAAGESRRWKEGVRAVNKAKGEGRVEETEQELIPAKKNSKQNPAAVLSKHHLYFCRHVGASKHAGRRNRSRIHGARTWRNSTPRRSSSSQPGPSTSSDSSSPSELSCPLTVPASISGRALLDG